VLGFVTLSACGLDSAYACTSDTQCSAGESRGRCEPEGYCSFQDDTCPSGRRYGVWAPAAFAKICVDTSASPTSTAETSTGQPTSGEPSTSAGPTTTLDPSSTQDATTLAPTSDATGDSSSSSSGGSGSESSSSGSTVLDPDLIAWYRFDAMDGDGVTDHSGNGHNASCLDSPGTADGVYGNAIETDGVGQHLVVANTPQFTMPTWTLATWVWSGAPPTSFVTILGKPVGVGVANSYEIGMNTSGMVTRIAAGWSDDVLSQGLGVTLPGSQEWFHVAATFSDTTGTLYLDGEIVDEEPLTVVPAFDDSDLYIGADVDNEALDNFFSGRIDDMRIYQRALTADEVAVIMAGENL